MPVHVVEKQPEAQAHLLPLSLRLWPDFFTVALTDVCMSIRWGKLPLNN